MITELHGLDSNKRLIGSASPIEDDGWLVSTTCIRGDRYTEIVPTKAAAKQALLENGAVSVKQIRGTAQ